MTVRVNHGGTGNDSLLIYNSANTTQLPLGTVNLGRTDYVGTNRTFGATGTKAKMTRSGNSITVVLGTQSGAGTTAPASGTMAWTPSASAYDRAGNANTTTTANESGAADRDDVPRSLRRSTSATTMRRCYEAGVGGPTSRGVARGVNSSSPERVRRPPGMGEGRGRLVVEGAGTGQPHPSTCRRNRAGKVEAMDRTRELDELAKQLSGSVRRRRWREQVLKVVDHQEAIEVRRVAAQPGKRIFVLRTRELED